MKPAMSELPSEWLSGEQLWASDVGIRASARVAVCFFGVTRNFSRYTLGSIRQSLLGPVAKLDPRFKKYGHFNVIDRISNPRTGEDNVPVDVEEMEQLGCHYLSQTDQLTAENDEEFQTQFEYFRRFEGDSTDQFIFLRNSLLQLLSLNRVTEMLLQSRHHFDLVIYSRVDLRFGKKVRIPKVRSNTLYTPWFDKFRGLNDRFALGDLETMVKYGQRGRMARQYCEETGKPFRSEKFLWWYVRQRKLRTADLMSIEFGRMRANGVLVCPGINFAARLKYFFKRALGPLRRQG